MVVGLASQAGRNRVWKEVRFLGERASANDLLYFGLHRDTYGSGTRGAGWGSIGGGWLQRVRHVLAGSLSALCVVDFRRAQRLEYRSGCIRDRSSER
jgi:hypothetical protein